MKEENRREKRIVMNRISSMKEKEGENRYIWPKGQHIAHELKVKTVKSRLQVKDRKMNPRDGK